MVGGKKNMDLQRAKTKEKFLAAYQESYGYPGGSTGIEELREIEFPRLKGVVYVDQAGAGLYAESQIKSTATSLLAGVYGNPHSLSSSSIRTSKSIDESRLRVLSFFHASPDDYVCVFTSGATSALRLVGESFQWSHNSNFCHTRENHNSVLGIREYALDNGATVRCGNLVQRQVATQGKEEMEWSFLETSCMRRQTSPPEGESSAGSGENNRACHLLAFPAESNFSGVRWNLDAIPAIRSGRHLAKRDGIVDAPRGSGPANERWFVLLDAAKACATNPPDLQQFSPDFVALSFYKIFGYPTGLGALLIRKDALPFLKKKYFGGGTVAAISPDSDFVRLRSDPEASLEDGTLPFLSFPALIAGFDAIQRLGMKAISRHVASLTQWTARQLSSLCHANGRKALVLYGCHGPDADYGLEPTSPKWRDTVGQGAQGGVVTWNAVRGNGQWVGHKEVDRLANLAGIQLRTGCFCNPGACAEYLGQSDEDLRANFNAGHVCGDEKDIVNGRPTGAVRVSFGYYSNFDDAHAVVSFVNEFFVEKSSPKEEWKEERGIASSNGAGQPRVATCPPPSRPITLRKIYVYPIKSCAGMQVDAWPLCPTGLLHDREFLLVGSSGRALTQKLLPSLCKIRPIIDLRSGQMVVTAPDVTNESLRIPLVSPEPQCRYEGKIRVCGDSSSAHSYGADVASWFALALGGTRCTLVRQLEQSTRRIRRPVRRAAGGSSGRGAEEDEAGREEDKEGAGSGGRDEAEGSGISGLSFANEGQFLVVSESSVGEVRRREKLGFLAGKWGRSWREGGGGEEDKGEGDDEFIRRFRPNFVVSGSEPFEEDQWEAFKIGGEYFGSLGGCKRCEMVNVNQSNGVKGESQQPLLTLASFRRVKGQIMFGVLFARKTEFAQVLEHNQEGDVEVESSLWQKSNDEVLNKQWLQLQYKAVVTCGLKVTPISCLS